MEPQPKKERTCGGLGGDIKEGKAVGKARGDLGGTMEKSVEAMEVRVPMDHRQQREMGEKEAEGEEREERREKRERERLKVKERE